MGNRSRRRRNERNNSRTRKRRRRNRSRSRSKSPAKPAPTTNDLESENSEDQRIVDIRNKIVAQKSASEVKKKSKHNKKFILKRNATTMITEETQSPTSSSVPTEECLAEKNPFLESRKKSTNSNELNN